MYYIKSKSKNIGESGRKDRGGSHRDHGDGLLFKFGMYEYIRERTRGFRYVLRKKTKT